MSLSEFAGECCERDGVFYHTLPCAFQQAPLEIQVLLPDQGIPGVCYPVVYLLPVEAWGESRWGDPLREVRAHQLHNLHQVICVVPGFDHLPWYADHPTNPFIRQESAFLHAVLPHIASCYPTLETPRGRRLLGFSKSGWGAFSLLLRHPQLFGKAAAWDAPLMQAQPNDFGMEEIFATQENFDPYQLSSLFEQHATQLRRGTYLALTGYSAFQDDMRRAHELLRRLLIPHHYADGPERAHHWESGWMPQAFALLMGDA